MQGILDKLWTYGKGRTLIAGHFYPQGSANPTTDADSNLGYSVQRSSTGIYVVSGTGRGTGPTDSFPALVSEWTTLRLNSPGTGNPWEIRGQASALSPWTYTMQILSNGTLTDPAAHTNNRVSFGFLFKNSTVGG